MHDTVAVLAMSQPHGMAELVNGLFERPFDEEPAVGGKSAIFPSQLVQGYHSHAAGTISLAEYEVKTVGEDTDFRYAQQVRGFILKLPQPVYQGIGQILVPGGIK